MRRRTDGRQHLFAEEQVGPSAEDDPLRVEQVDQVRDADTQVQCGLVQYLRPRRRGGARSISAANAVLVATGQRAAALVENCLGTYISLQAPERAAPAGAAAHHDGGVPLLARAGGGAAQRCSVRDDARAHTGADQANDHALRAAPCAEP